MQDTAQHQYLKQQGLIWSCVTTFILWAHAQLYVTFLSDDALISMRYSERLLEGKGLTWTDGIPVEGYSNLLWVLLTASLGAIGLDLVDAVRVLGFVCNASVIFALFYLFIQRNTLQSPSFNLNSKHLTSSTLILPPSILPLIIAQLFWVLLGSTAVWTMGGLEQPLLTASLVWAVALVIPALHKIEIDYSLLMLASTGLAAVVLTRPDGPLFTVCLCIVWWWSRPKTSKNFIAGILLGLLPFIAFAGQMGFRLAYYGDWVPNTAHVKVVFTQSRLISGIMYTTQALASASPFFEFALLGFAYNLYTQKRNTKNLQIKYTTNVLMSIFLPLIAWLAYITSVGGDIFPAFRHGLVMYGLLALAVLVITQQSMPLFEKVGSKWIQVGMIALLMIPFWISQVSAPANREAFYETWEWDGQAVGETLQQAFGESQPLYAVTAAGSLPYWSKLPVLDMLGLNDYHIARNPPADFGLGELGHDLGDGAYVLQRKPGLISFCGPYGSIDPCRLSGQQMVKTKEFNHFYTPLFIKIKPTNGREAFTNVQWIRWQDSPIGMKQNDQISIIPAYLAAHTTEQAAQLNSTHQLIIVLKSGHSLELPTQIVQALAKRHNLNTASIKIDFAQLEPSQNPSIILKNSIRLNQSNTQLILTNISDQDLELKQISIEEATKAIARI